ncbi:hypothetical protein EW146_g2533 [Bondarzewia mesenterica]|uniref:Sec1-like protein n=1 Tax=Bondarzewia mesenterica TaxID=1095465 RepID=A0A4S4M6H9_9AGAM|nr:hypothetical protein EW146_g2533 [Bondarzewia mesenterica]
MTSLIATIRSKFLDAIRSVNPAGRWKILVVDEHSQRLLNGVLKQFDILEENVTLIESITNNREPQPAFEAIYMLMPTTPNVDRIIRDFANGRQQYAAAHLFFIEGLDEQLFEKLTSSPAEPHLKGLQELFVNFWPIEAQTFSLKMPGQFFSMFSPPRNDKSVRASRDRLEEDLRFVSKAIANVCITMNEFPYIRYYLPSNHPPLGAFKPHESTRAPPPLETSRRWRTDLARGAEARAYESADSDFLSKILAFMVQATLDEHKKANPDFPKQEAGRPRSTLIITDRSMDVLAPLIHEFTYQAMANDLLPIEDGIKYTCGSPPPCLYKFQSSIGAYEDKTATLSDADSVWTEVRHMHMREAIDKLMADFNQFMQDNAGFKGEGAATLNDMKDMLASLPQYQEQREKFSLHLNMAQECMAIFERDKLPVVATVEQNCATGLTATGKSPKHLVEEMVPLLDSREVINPNKVRIIALYIQYREGVPDEDRRRLYQHARLSLAEQDAVNALAYLGIRISRGPSDKDARKKIKQKPSNEEEYELSRYKPFLRTVLEQHTLQDQVAGKLDQTIFPYVKDYPSAQPIATTRSMRQAPTPATSLRSAKPSWHRAARPGASTETRERLFVFVAGGMTYSEMREAYQLSSSLSKDIYIGSTHTFTPRQFVDDLKVLELGGVGSRAIPNGLKDPRDGKRSHQEYYDEIYFTRDAPPPQSRPPPSPAPTNSKLSRPSPVSSMSAMSVGTTSSGNGKDEKKEKKKRGLFKW